MLKSLLSNKPFQNFNYCEVITILTVILYSTWILSLSIGYINNSPKNLDYFKKPIGADFVQFYTAGTLFRTDQSNLYNYEVQKKNEELILNSTFDGYYNFNYPPIVSHFFKYFSLLEYKTAFVLWTLIQLGCLFYCLKSLNLFNKENILLCLGFIPVFSSLSFGQNGLISLALLSKSKSELNKNNSLLSGIFLGLLSFKPQLLAGIALILIFTLKQNVRFIIGILFSLFIILIVHLTLYHELSLNYINLLSGKLNQLTSSNVFPIEKSFSMYSALSYYNFLNIIKFAFLISCFCYLLFKFKANIMTNKFSFEILILSTCLLSPYLMLYDLCILLIPVLTLFKVTKINQIESYKYFLLANIFFLTSLFNMHWHFDLIMKVLFVVIIFKLINKLNALLTA